MKVTQNKQNRWLYLVLILMILALVGFSIFPLLNSIVKVNHDQAQTSVLEISSEKLAQLESQANGYQIVLEREPDNQTALKGLLEIRLQQGDLQGATIPLEKLARLHQDQTEYRILLAQAKEQLEDYSGAKQDYQQILSYHPGDFKALQGLVNLLSEQDQGEEAISILQNVLNNPPENIDIYSVKLLLAQVYALDDRDQEAIAIYDQMIEADAEDFRPVLSKALILKQQGKDTEAESLFTTASSLAPAVYQEQIEAMAQGQ